MLISGTTTEPRNEIVSVYRSFLQTPQIGVQTSKTVRADIKRRERYAICFAFLQLDEAVPSEAVFVIVYRSDERAETLWGQLNN